jgi:hypothetical protein
MRWDNYLSIYLARYGTAVSRLYMLTHSDGDAPSKNFIGGHLWDIPGNIDFWLDQGAAPWLVNVDLDYFFWHDAEEPGVMVSDDYLEACFRKLRLKIEDDTVAVTTIALTPTRSFTGGWSRSERIAERVLNILGLEFRLPPN